MWNVPNIKIAKLLALFSKGYIWLLALLALFCYPLAIFPPAVQIGPDIFFNLPYTISFPASIILGILAIPVIAFHRWKLPLYLQVALITFIVSLLVNVPQELEYLDGFLILLGYVTIPLAAAILNRYKHVSLSGLASWSTVLWCIQIVLGMISLHRFGQPVGTPGNVNWMAAFLLMLSPFVFYFLQGKIKTRLENRTVSLFLAFCLWFFPTFFLLYHCQSRAAWLAVTLLPVFLVLIKLHRPLLKTIYLLFFLLGILGCVAAAYIWYPNQLLRVVEKDVRLPLWTGTAVMVVKNPFGVGSGRYQEHFTPLRRVSSYQNRLYAADMTNHPHNELLNVGAQLGIPALLAFLIMLFQLTRTTSKEPFAICTAISGYFVVITAMFDLTLVRPPTSFLGLFILGLTWPISSGVEDREVPKMGWPLLGIASTLFAVGFITLYSYFDLRHDVYHRKGMISEKKGKSYALLGLEEESRNQYLQAISLYGKADVFFNRLIPYYKKGYLYLKMGGEMEQAEKNLNLVAAIDPHFSHINMLLSQLSLQKRDLASAEKYLQRECALYPRNEKAFQTMYTFSAAVGNYMRLQAIDSHLKDIYQERARQNFGKAGLAGKTAALRQAVVTGNLLVGVEKANALLDRINVNFTDPIFTELSVGKKWPTKLYSGGFTPLDLQTWHLRQTLDEQLRKEFGNLPVDPRQLFSWFVRTITIDGKESSVFPLNVWQKKRGSLSSTYLLLALVLESNQNHSILQLDDQGRVVGVTLFANTQNSTSSQGPKRRGVTFYDINILDRTINPIPPNTFYNTFRWIPGKTVLFYPFTDYFLRNQILVSLMENSAHSLLSSPPMSRILHVFALTGHTPPPITLLKKFIFTHNIEEVYSHLRK